MIKKQYLKELNLTRLLKSGIKDATKPGDVSRVQEWINLRRFTDPKWLHRIEVDGNFGPQTEKVVRAFQHTYGLKVDGEVGDQTFRELTKPMAKAFTRIKGDELRSLIVKYADQHLINMPRELYNSNSGPWVRSYMDGNEGKQWAWCMGFVQTIIDQASTSLSLPFQTLMPKTYSCDVIGEYGKKKKRLIRNANLRTDPSHIKIGDVFLVVKQPWDWTHTGIVIGLDNDLIHTIEGNTNDEGVREGFEVCRRFRNFQTSNIDIYSVLPE